MSNGFDPYYKWLGIPPEEQPPNHYRLLGLRNFEHDSDVIEAAAEQRMLLLRSRQTGPQSEACQRLLNEIAAAQLCLLDANDRRQYNEGLRSAAHERVISAPPPVPVARDDQQVEDDAAGDQRAEEVALAAPQSDAPQAPAPQAPVYYIGEGRIASPESPPVDARSPSEPPLSPPLPPALPSAKAALTMRSPQPYDVDNVVVIEDEPETPLDAQVIDGAPPVDSWHVQTPDGSYWGPVSRSELDDWAAKGRITPGCKLLPAGASEWFEASKVLARLPPAPPKIADATHATANPTGHPFRCPRCGCEDPPREYREITATGWVMFVLLLVFFFPLCFLGLLVTETKRVCPKCGLKIS